MKLFLNIWLSYINQKSIDMYKKLNYNIKHMKLSNPKWLLTEADLTLKYTLEISALL